MPADITLRQAQQTIDTWITTVGVRYYHELTNLAILVEEVGELARLFAREFGEQSYKDGVTRPEIADEMADVLFTLIAMANQTGVDLDDALQRNLAKKTVRDRARHAANPKLKEPNDDA